MPPQPGPCVAVIEDDDLISLALEVLLVDAGFHVHTARDGRAGYGIIRRHHPDVVVLDLNMPEVDGLSLLHRLSEADGEDTCAVIACSADTTLGPAALAAGARVFLSKPFDPTALVAMVRELAEGRKQP